MSERSYVMIKPGFANHEQVIKEIEKRIKSHNLRIVEKRYVRYSPEMADEHYAEHIGKSFYPGLKEYITSDKVLGMIVEGSDAILKIRELVGSTKNPAEGTIRYDIPEMLHLERRVTENVIHASDSTESAKREIEIFGRLTNEMTGHCK